MIRVVKASFLLMIGICAIAQPTDIQAKSAFLSAQDAYGNGDYPTAIEKLEHVKKLLGSTNPRVEHLLANAYLENGEADKAEASMKMYFKLAADNDANYMSMLRLTETIREKREEIQRLAEKKEVERIETEAYQNALKTNTSEAYASFLESYPDSPYRLQAIKAWNALPTDDLVDSRDGNRYKTTRIGSQIWMAEDLKYETKGSTYNKKYGLRVYDFEERKNELCPDGWNLPSSNDISYMLTSFGLDSIPVDGTEFANDAKNLFRSLANQAWEDVGGTNTSGLGFKPLYKGPSNNFSSLLLSDGYFIMVSSKSKIVTTSQMTYYKIDKNSPPRFYMRLSANEFATGLSDFSCRSIKE